MTKRIIILVKDDEGAESIKHKIIRCLNSGFFMGKLDVLELQDVPDYIWEE